MVRFYVKENSDVILVPALPLIALIELYDHVGVSFCEGNPEIESCTQCLKLRIIAFTKQI